MISALTIPSLSGTCHKRCKLTHKPNLWQEPSSPSRSIAPTLKHYDNILISKERNMASVQSSQLPRQKSLTGRAAHTTVRTGLVYSGSLRCGATFT